MGLLDTKRARRRPVGSLSTASVARHSGEPSKRASEAPIGSRRGKPQPQRTAVVRVEVRDKATIRNKIPGAEIGFEFRRTIARWPEDLRDLWEERAAILEYDAGLPRLVAERRAYQIVRDANEAAVLLAEGEQ